MEAVGATRIFQRFIVKRGLKYAHYYGDGDSKGFISVKDTCGKDSVTKYECIGLVKKRVVDSGAQISVFKSSVKGKEMDYKGYLMLQPVFGDCLKDEVDIGLVTNGYITLAIKTVVATVDGLNLDILLDTETYEGIIRTRKNIQSQIYIRWELKIKYP
ncbi:retrovirus-related Pol polyprotein from transposon opus [Trichonephila clavipes]|nr:retrovirus-related Pol polyprotein from transposon opus [Trichonephila clavipes]